MKEFDFENVGKRMPYSVPEGFFEGAKQRAKAIASSSQDAVHHGFTPIFSRVAIAAAVALAIFGAAWWSYDYNSLERRHERLLADISTDLLMELVSEYDPIADEVEYY